MAELEIVPEVLTDPNPEPGNELGQISDLIAGDSPDKPEAVEAESEQSDPPAALETDAAEPEQDSPEPGEPLEVDYDQVVPMPDGAESVTVGQLKDHYQAKADFDQERDSWESSKMAQDNQLIAAKHELFEVAEMMGDVKPELAEYLNKRRVADRERNVALLDQAMPQWSDPELKKTDRGRMVAALQPYGFSEADFAQIGDYRVIKVVYDMARLLDKEAKGQAKAEALKAELPKGRKSPQRKQTATQATRAKVERAKGGTDDEKFAAIGALIDGV